MISATPSDTTPLPLRAGVRPKTSKVMPHMQLDQQPLNPYSNELLELARELPGVVLAWSRRAPEHTVGLYLESSEANGPEDGFMLGTEFAHVHPTPDFSLHLTLPEPIRTEAINAGWVEPHPFAGYPTVSPLIVLLFASRDEAELAIAKRLLKASWAYAYDGRI